MHTAESENFAGLCSYRMNKPVKSFYELTLTSCEKSLKYKKWKFTKPKFDSAESDFSNFMIEYLGEIETEFKKSIILFITGLDGFESWKSRDTLS